MLGALIAWVMGSACVADAGAQTVRRIGDQIWLRVPTEVVVYAAEESTAITGPLTSWRPLGRAEIVLKDLGPYPRTVDPLSVAPRSAPVRTVFADGSSAPGRWIENPAEHQVTHLIFDTVAGVIWNPDAGYRTVGGVNWLDARSSKRDSPMWAPGARFTRPAFRHSIPIDYGHAFRPRLDFSIDYHVQGALPPGVDPAQLDAAFVRVTNRFLNAMAQVQNSGPVSITVVFDPNNVAFVADTQHHTLVQQDYLGFALGYFLQGLNADEPDAPLFTDNLPPGPGVPCEWNNGSTTNVTQVISSGPAWRQLYGETPPPPDATISLDSTLRWDTDMSDGIQADAWDIEMALTHETIHALGFMSVVDLPPAQQLRNAIAWADLFRFGAEGPVSPTEFLLGARSLVGNQAARAATTPTTLGVPSESFARSRGELVANEKQADHWRRASLNNGAYIGIMAPTYDPGRFPVFVGYCSNADWGFLDATGWNITRPVPPLDPFSCALSSPGDGQQIVSRSPTLSWQPNNSAESVAVYLHEGAAITSTSLRFSQTGLTSTFVTIPWGVLQGGRVYTWFVTAHNGDYFTLSARRTFSTQCAADYDDGSGTGTPDGGVTIDDLLYYIPLFENGDIEADLDDGTGTGTPDGGVTIDDLLFFLVRFDAGC